MSHRCSLFPVGSLFHAHEGASGGKIPQQITFNMWLQMFKKAASDGFNKSGKFKEVGHLSYS